MHTAAIIRPLLWILCFIWCKRLESCGNSTHLCWHRQMHTFFCTSCFLFAVCRLVQVPCVLERESDFTCLSFLVGCIFSHGAHTCSQLQVCWHPLHPVDLHCYPRDKRPKDKHICCMCAQCFLRFFFLKLGQTTCWKK